MIGETKWMVAQLAEHPTRRNHEPCCGSAKQETPSKVELQGHQLGVCVVVIVVAGFLTLQPPALQIYERSSVLPTQNGSRRRRRALYKALLITPHLICGSTSV